MIPQVVQRQSVGEVGKSTTVEQQIHAATFLPKIIEIS